MPVFTVSYVVTERTRQSVEIEAPDAQEARRLVEGYDFDNSKASEEIESLLWEVSDVEAVPAFLPTTCRKCEAVNPMVSLAPVDNGDGTATCICLPCASARGWLDRDGNLKPGVGL